MVIFFAYKSLNQCWVWKSYSWSSGSDV